MSKLPKQLRKQIRNLINIAYTRELTYQLDNLAKKFDDWRENKIDCWELSDLIHKFHDGTSRDLYKMYNYFNDDVYLVARAILHGFLKKDELSDELLELTNKVARHVRINENIDDKLEE